MTMTMTQARRWTPFRHGALDERIGALLQADPKPLGQRPPTLFDHLSDAQAEQIMAKGKAKVLYRGATLFSQGAPNDGLYLIETGRVRVFYTAPSGREITLAFWHPGNFVGGPEVFGGGLHVWSGVAASNTSVVHYSGTVLRDLVMQTPAFAISVIEALAFKGKCYSAMAQMLGTRSVTERLAHLLLHLSDLYGAPDEHGTQIAARFTHEDLAHLVGATRQWVTISLKRLAEQGVVIAERASITICRPDVLRAICDGAAEHRNPPVTEVRPA